MNEKTNTPLSAALENRVPEAWTNLLAYVLQDDIHNRLTPRVIDITYTAFMLAKRPNTEDGGASDWFNDTKPAITKLIEKLRKDLIKDRAASPASPAAQEVRPTCDCQQGQVCSACDPIMPVDAAPWQGAQEPVAWRYKFKEDLQWQYTQNKEQAHRLAVIEPLYTASQPAPLSVREVFERWQTDVLGRSLDELSIGSALPDDYDNVDVHNEWVAWQACATIAAQRGH